MFALHLYVWITQGREQELTEVENTYSAPVEQKAVATRPADSFDRRSVRENSRCHSYLEIPLRRLWSSASRYIPSSIPSPMFL
jgi:hypothetical protein